MSEGSITAVRQVYNEVFVYFSIQYYYPVFLPKTYMIFII